MKTNSSLDTPYYLLATSHFRNNTKLQDIKEISNEELYTYHISLRLTEVNTKNIKQTTSTHLARQKANQLFTYPDVMMKIAFDSTVTVVVKDSI